MNVKWNKQTFQVDLNTDEEPRLFKAQLYAITAIAIERQKVLFKGKQIQDDTWGDLVFKKGVTLLLMGSHDDIPKAPESKTVFVEDLNENKLTELLNLPAGLENLGNTCYINATVQCLKTVPEFCNKIRQCEISDLDDTSLLAQALKFVYDNMETRAVVEPTFLVSTILKAIPRFAENQHNGVFQQQDANEFWTELLRLLRNKMKPIENPIQDENSPKYESFIDQYFGGTIESTLKCTETEEEEPTTSKENFLQLSCFINADVKYLLSGLRAKLEEQLTKHSPKLERNATYQKSSKLARLPAYLFVQMVRYVYKERESINAKILKDIKFSMSLDVFELCTPELQRQLLAMRSKFKEYEDRLCELKVNQGDQQKKAGAANEAQKEEDNKYVYPNYFKDDLGSNNSGFYELQAVLTHKGRSSSSGHYVAWIKRKKGELWRPVGHSGDRYRVPNIISNLSLFASADTWYQCDDDVVSPVTEEEILKLSGGGDWHTAYVLVYGSRSLAVDKNEDGTPSL